RLIFDECYQAAEGGLTTVEFPGEAANPDTLVEHFVDHSACILSVEDAMREHLVVHELQVIFGPDFFKRPAELLGALRSLICTYCAQDCVHRMIHRGGINREPGDFALKYPGNKLACWPRVHVKIPNFVWLRLPVPVALII